MHTLTYGRGQGVVWMHGFMLQHVNLRPQGWTNDNACQTGPPYMYRLLCAITEVFLTECAACQRKVKGRAYSMAFPVQVFLADMGWGVVPDLNTVDKVGSKQGHWGACVYILKFVIYGRHTILGRCRALKCLVNLMIAGASCKMRCPLIATSASCPAYAICDCCMLTSN